MDSYRPTKEITMSEKHDKRSETSAVNGKLGGRPPIATQWVAVQKINGYTLLVKCPPKARGHNHAYSDGEGNILGTSYTWYALWATVSALTAGGDDDSVSL